MTPRIRRRCSAFRCATTCARAAIAAALLVLADGRLLVATPYAAAVGGARQLQAYARRRLTRETDETARAWWQEVIGALAR